MSDPDGWHADCEKMYIAPRNNTPNASFGASLGIFLPHASSLTKEQLEIVMISGCFSFALACIGF